MEDTPHILASDVAKGELVFFNGKDQWATPNEAKEILAVLRRHPGWLLVCEPTSDFHLELAMLAHQKGLPVCLVNPKEIKNYRECRSFRAKTDKIDAVTIFEFAQRHSEVLRRWEPPAKELAELRHLIGKRHTLVRARTSLTMSFGKSPRCNEILKSMTELIDEMEKDIHELASQFDDYHLLRSMPGVGPHGGAALTYVLNVHEFADADALVAFVGLDLRVRDSGKFRGKRKLSKRGDPVLRYFITMTGFGLLRHKIAKPTIDKLTAQKRCHNEQGVIAARKILRVAHHLHKTKTHFNSEKWTWMLDKKT